MKYLKIVGLVLVFVILTGVLLFLTKDVSFPVLTPRGEVAQKQLDLILITTFLMLIVVIPVFIMTFTIAWKYREGNTKPKKYKPEWDHNRNAELIWWGFPLAIIIVLSVIIWRSSHELDPYKPLVSNEKPITIQVVALQWKWLFIYPEQDIATVNYIQFPENTPINFEITADAPMNSFWIPSLGGQVYAMPGMETKLHLIADRQGEYAGSSANLSGEGFAGMKFIAKASTREEFQSWVQTIDQQGSKLDTSSYATLMKKTINDPPSYYGSAQKDLFDTIVMKYMTPKVDVNTVEIDERTNE